MSRATGCTSVSIVLIYPTMLGLYGDRGNALVLSHRATMQGFSPELITVHPGEQVPQLADIYLLGGGEDAAQAEAASLLRTDGGLAAATGRNATILAVCAGLQILGTEFSNDDRRVPGLDLIDATTRAGTTRTVGEIVTVCSGLPLLTGYENHRGRTTLGPGVQPFGEVKIGVADGADTKKSTSPRHDGYVVGHTIGTYLHGPVLARNPALADLLLSWATGQPLQPIPDTFADAIRAERLGATITPSRRISRWSRHRRQQ